MVTLDQAIQVLSPGAVLSPQPGPNCVVLSLVAGVQAITYWDSALGTQPTSQHLATVTTDQVTAVQAAAVNNAAATALETAKDPISVANRGDSVAQWTHLNDAKELAWAFGCYLCQQLNLPVPTAQQLAAIITTNRVITPVDPAATTPAEVAAIGGVRLNQTVILGLIGAVLSSGGGLPGGE